MRRQRTSAFKGLVGAAAVVVVLLAIAVGIHRVRTPLKLTAPTRVALRTSRVTWHTSAASAAVEIQGGPPLFQFHPEVKRAIASTTKLMTAYIMLRHPGYQTKREVTITPSMVVNDRQGILKGDSEVPVRVGERVTVGDLSWALMLPSADDAAWMLSDIYPGGSGAFIREMNRTAHALGMTETHYVDPDGVSHVGYSTARDLLKLTTQDMALVRFRTLVGSKTHRTRAFGTLTNLNQLLWSYPGATGVKTGWTPSAGSCLVFSATRKKDGHRLTLYGVVLGDSTLHAAFQDAAGLLNAGFHLSWKIVLPTRQVVARASVRSVWGARPLTFSLKGSLGTFATSDHAEIQYHWLVMRTWRAHQVVGYARVLQAGWPKGRWVRIVANQTYQPSWWQRL